AGAGCSPWVEGGAVQALAAIFLGVGSLINLVCFILLVVKMFQNGKTGLGVLCIVLLFCCGIGNVVAFIYGWIKSAEWNLRTVMMVWTVGVILDVAGAAMNPSQFQQLQHFPPVQGP